MKREFTCEKCSHHEVTVKYVHYIRDSGERIEELGCRCSRCGFLWSEPVNQNLKAPLGDVARFGFDKEKE